MGSLVSRRYCVTHPVEIVGLFGLDIYLRELFGGRKTVLERASEKFSKHRLPMFGPVGDAYRLSALFELRAARIYQGMAERFKDVVPAQRLFQELHEEEREHARMMNICLHSVKMGPSVTYVPSVCDAGIREQMQHLREVQRRVSSMSLGEALRITEEVEQGEVNTIFGRLLGQVEEPEAALLRRHMDQVENHSTSVPRRIQELRQRLAELGLGTV